MANRWRWKVVTVDELGELGAISIVCLALPRSHVVMQTDQHYWGAAGARESARGLLAIWREEAIAYVAGYSKFKR